MHLLLFLFIILIPDTLLYSRGIKLTGIPGQEKEMDIQSMMDQIMYPYHEEITNLNHKIRDKEIEQKLWIDFKVLVNNFDQINKYIIGHESPFRSITNFNSHPHLLEVKTDRTASPGSYSLSIKQLATSHSIASAPIDISKEIVPGNFTINIDNQAYPVNFVGGNLQALVGALKNQLSSELNIKTINSSEDKQILTFSSKQEGEKSAITFGGDIAPLIDISMLRKDTKSETNIMWSNNLKANLPNTELKKTLNYLIDTNMLLSFDIFLESISPESISNTNKIDISDLSITEIGAIENDLFILPGSKPILKEIDQKEKTELHSDLPSNSGITLNFDDGSTEKLELLNQKYLIPLKTYQGKILKTIEVIAENIKLSTTENLTFTTSPEDTLKPYKEITPKQDAIFLLDGLEIRRPSNIISDLIPGVTFSLLQESPDTNISININKNTQLIKDSIVQWILAYNNIMEEIFSFTTVPIKKIGKLKPLYQREKDGDDLKEGSFYGNFSLLSFKDRLRQLSGRAHSRIEGNIALLDHIGIYVNRRNSLNSDPDVLRKGTLTLDTDELEMVLNNKFEEVHNLFVYDNSGNGRGDEGVAVTSLEIDKLMLGENGYLNKTDLANMDKLKQLSDKITKKEDEIERTERKERKALLEMNKAITESKTLSESLKQRLNN